MHDITHILFDLGNTLVYFEGDWPAVLHEAIAAIPGPLSDAGLELDEPRFLTEFHAALENYYAQRDIDLIEHTSLHVLRATLTRLGAPILPEPLLRTALDAFYTVTQSHWRPEPEALPTLRTLHKRGYRMGIVSNASYDADPQRQVFAHGLRTFLDFVLTSAYFGLRKPHPKIFLRALEYWSAPPARVVMVGDTLSADILGAHQAGLPAVWITRHVDPAGMEMGSGRIRPDAVIASLSDLPEILAR